MNNPYKFPRFHVARWAVAWVDLIQALAEILSLGFWQPMWSFKVQGWFIDKFEKWSTEK